MNANRTGTLPAAVLEGFLRTTVGLRLRDGDGAALSAWIADRCAHLGLPTPLAYRALLDSGSEDARHERELLTVRFTAGETYFFRDRGQFDLLAGRLLPELMERRARERRLRIWSAGCSTGEEAYSLGMLLREQGAALAGWDLQVVGTDINTASLQHARTGVYGRWSFRTLGDARRRAHFHAEGDRWRVDAQLRELVRFRPLDLLHDAFGAGGAGLHDVDLVLCRNVFIYLDTGAVARIAGKLAESLAPGGYLVTGHGELIGHTTSSLSTRVFPQSVVLQHAPPEPVAPVAPVAPVVRAVPPPPPVVPARVPEAPAPTAPAESVASWMEAAWRAADRGRAEQAAALCRQCLAREPLAHGPHYLLAQLALERGDSREAASLLRKVIYLEPGYVAAYVELGALLEHDGDPARARQMLETARRELQRRAPAERVPPYGASTAGELLAYVDGLLHGAVRPAAPTSQGAPAQAAG